MRYLDLLPPRESEKSERSEIKTAIPHLSPFSLFSPSQKRGEPSLSGGSVAPVAPATQLDPYHPALAVLAARVPDRVDREVWEQAAADARRFLAQWGEQAEAVGWTARDLFGLHEVPDRPSPTYRRLSRYDETGLVWLLRGREVVALTETTAAMRDPSGSVLTYRKFNKPAYGPVGDSLDDFV
jgi:hypothetical protein